MRELGKLRVFPVVLVLALSGVGASQAMDQEWCFSEACAGTGWPGTEVIENLPSGSLSFHTSFRTLHEFFPTVIPPGGALVTLEMVDSADTSLLGFGVVNNGGGERLNIKYQVSPGVYSDLPLGVNAAANDLTITWTPGAAGSISVTHNSVLYTTGTTAVSGDGDKIYQGHINSVNVDDMHFEMEKAMQVP